MLETFTWYFLSPHGRIRRQEFLLGYLGLVIVTALSIRIFSAIVLPRVRYYQGRYDGDPTGKWIVLLVLVVVLWPLAAVFVKRLHDLNVSGWWMLAALAIAPVAAATNTSGWIFTLLIVVVLSLLPGTSGNNRFGHDPRPSASL